MTAPKSAPAKPMNAIVDTITKNSLAIINNPIVIISPNCKKMDKLLRIDYATQNPKIRLFQATKTYSKQMTVCTTMRTPSGPNPPAPTAPSSPNPIIKSAFRLMDRESRRIRIGFLPRASSSRECSKSSRNKRGNTSSWTRSSSLRRQRDSPILLIHISRGLLVQRGCNTTTSSPNKLAYELVPPTLLPSRHSKLNKSSCLTRT